MNPYSISSVLGFVVVAPALFLAVVTVLFMLAVIEVYLWLYRPFMDWLTREKGGLFKRIVFWPVRKASASVDRYVREHVAALTRWAAANTAPATIMFLQLAEVVQRLTGTIGDMSEQTWRALWTLNHETIPRKIAAATLPLRQRLDRHTDRLDALEDLNRRVAVAVGDTLRALPWGVPGGYVTNIETFLDRFTQLWRHYWDVTRAQLNTLLSDTIPELRRDVADLGRRLDVQIDARFDALGARISELERWRENVVMPRLGDLAAAVDALAGEVFGEAGEGLTALLERVTELERQIGTVIPSRLDALQAGLDALRTELEEGIRTGIDVFRERVETLEREVFTEIPQRLAGMQLAIDTLAAEVFTEVGAGLSALTERIVALETEIQTRILPGFDLILGRITAVETDIRDNILPRLRGIEDLLAPAAFAALIIATLRTSAPYLFCRNVVNAARRICGTNESDFSALMNALMFAAFIGNLEWYVRGMQAVVGTATDIVHGALDPTNRSEVSSEGDVTTEPAVEPPPTAPGGGLLPVT